MSDADTHFDPDDPLFKLFDPLPGAAHLQRLTSLVLDVHDAIGALENRVLRRTNGDSDELVDWETVGRLAMFVKDNREPLKWALEELDRVDASLADLGSLANGNFVDIPRFDVRGRPNYGPGSRSRRIDEALGIT